MHLDEDIDEYYFEEEEQHAVPIFTYKLPIFKHNCSVAFGGIR